MPKPPAPLNFQKPSLRQTQFPIRDNGLVLIVKELHETIDALVAQAYGWPQNLPDEQILARLAALNAQRAQEESNGIIRWLRPDYQMNRAGLVAPPPREKQLEAELVAASAKQQKPAFPTDGVERTAAVFASLAIAPDDIDAATLARTFRQGTRVERPIARILASLARMGAAHSQDGQKFTLRRRA